MVINLSLSGQGNPLVLFHGWGFDSQIWQPLLADLENHFSLYRVDLPGFGNSDFMDWQEFKNMLLAMLPSQFAVLGWSLGGLFAMRLAAEHPERLSHLINIASLPLFVESKRWIGIKTTVLNNFHSLLAKDPAKTIAHFLALQRYKPALNSVNIPSKEALTYGLNALHTWDLREALDHFEKPTCFMFGRLDSIIPFAALDKMRKRYPNFQYSVFRKSAHMPFLSEPAFFLETLKGLLL